MGMMEACKQDLNKSVEQYAKLPNQPELLELQKVPPLELWEGLSTGFIPFLCASFVCSPISFPMALMPWCIWAGIVSLWLWPHFKAKVANGDRPLENARRQKAYEEAMAVTLKAAEPIKAAEDYRLLRQIRELEGLVKTVGEKETDVRRTLATL